MKRPVSPQPDLCCRLINSACASNQPPPRWLVFLVLPFLVLLAPVVCSATDLAVQLSRFQRIVHTLIANSSASQADFAEMALAELAQVYMAEADLARKEAGDEGANRSKLLGWSLAVDQYANQLLVLHEEIAAGLPARLSLEPGQPVTVTVQGRRLMLSHPRRGQQAAYEQRILVDFCARETCDRLAGGDAVLTPIPVSAAVVSPVWSFSTLGPVCTYQGISVQFSSPKDLPWGRSICTQLMQEAGALATEIAWQRLQGVEVDWAELSVVPTPHRPEHLVALNGAGDSVLVSLPLVHGSPGLLRDITPWLRSISSRGEPVSVALQAARYGWESCCAVEVP